MGAVELLFLNTSINAKSINLFYIFFSLHRKIKGSRCSHSVQCSAPLGMEVLTVHDTEETDNIRKLSNSQFIYLCMIKVRRCIILDILL